MFWNFTIMKMCQLGGKICYGSQLNFEPADEWKMMPSELSTIAR